MGVTHIDQLSDEEKARFDEWADRWIDIGLRTGPADRERFEASVRDCYRYAGIDFPEVVIWVPSPLVLSFAAPAAAFAIELIEAVSRHPELLLNGDAVDGAVDDAVRDAVGDAVDGAVRDAVGDAVDGAVRDAVRGAVDGAVRDAVGDAVDGAVDGAVRGAVDDAVDGAVGDAVRGAVRGAVRDAVLRAVQLGWNRRFAGQLWPGGWYWGGAWTSFFREVCKLELPGDLWDRGKAFEGTIESACWWWPHRRFVMVSERPVEIHRELVSPARSRGFGSHRLHNDNGPAVSWPDGWGVWASHGVRVTKQVIERPESLTVEQIRGEQNVEVRRVMMEGFGHERYIRESGATLVHEDEWGKLWRTEISDDEDLVVVEVENSTAEPDGSYRSYMLRVHPELRPLYADGTNGDPQKPTARNAVASTFGCRGEDYMLEMQT